MSITAKIEASLGWDWQDGVRDNSALRYAEDLASGSGANQVEAAWHLESVVLTDASTDYDLTNLTRTVLGSTITTNLLTVKAIQVVNLTETALKILNVGGSGGNEWSEPFGDAGDTVEVPNDSVLLLSHRRCGWEVDDSNKLLRITATGAVTYSIAIVGTTTLTAGECSSIGL